MNDQEAIEAVKTLGAKRLLNHIHGHWTDYQYINLSFSLSGEDLVLRKRFKRKLASGTAGFYVDVGCSDPRNGSNTYLFYCYGWRGVCIDPNPQFVKPYGGLRPRDTFVNVAVGDTEGTIYWGRHKTDQGRSIVRQSKEDFGPEFDPPQLVPALPLSEILNRSVPPNIEIDFMSMDLEGAEFAALESNDWQKYRPEVIVLETIGIDEDRPSDYPTVMFLARRGYKFRGLLGHNVLMVRAD